MSYVCFHFLFQSKLIRDKIVYTMLNLMAKTKKLSHIYDVICNAVTLK